MRVNDEETYDIANGTVGRIRRHDPGRLEGLLHQRRSLTEDGSDTDYEHRPLQVERASSTPNHLDSDLERQRTAMPATATPADASWTRQLQRRPDLQRTQRFGASRRGARRQPLLGQRRWPTTATSSSSRPSSSSATTASPETRTSTTSTTANSSSSPRSNRARPRAPSRTPAAKRASPGSRCRRTAATWPSSRRAASTGYDNAGYSEMYTYEPDDRPGRLRLLSAGGATADLERHREPQRPVHDRRRPRLLRDRRTRWCPRTPTRSPTSTSSSTAAHGSSRAERRPARTKTPFPRGGPGGTRPGLVGVSADGTDVFFATYDVLVGQDRNGDSIKIYDARTGGGFPFVPPKPRLRRGRRVPRRWQRTTGARSQRHRGRASATPEISSPGEAEKQEVVQGPFEEEEGSRSSKKRHSRKGGRRHG